MGTLSLSRADRHTQAVVQLLKTLTDKQLIDVLQGVLASVDAPAGGGGPRRRGKPCTICGLIYPLHMKRWGDDHPFERPARETQTSDAEGAPEAASGPASVEPSEPSASEPSLCAGCGSRGACTLHGCLGGRA